MSDTNDEVEAYQGGDVPEEGAEPGLFLSWVGRRQARLAIPKPRILEEVAELGDPTESDPGNLLIEGDNRQAMVSLLAQYAGKVDVALLDPPYNTGKRDFRYDDARFADPDADTAKGDFISAENGGRHAMWLNQMAPTLRILKDLMSPTGVVFIHIDDRELPRLLLLMEEIFLESNKIGLITWKNATDNNPTRIAVEHEYVVCWARDIENVPKVWKSPAAETRDAMLAKFDELKAQIGDPTKLAAAWRQFISRHKSETGGFTHYNKVDEHGPYTGMRSIHNPGKEGYRYDVIHPNGKPVEQPMRGYRYSKTSMGELIAQGRIIFAADETQLIQLKVYLSEADVSLHGVVEMDGRSATLEVASLFPDQPGIFPMPKPVAFEEFLLSFVADTEAVVLDCFAGSGTTGHAVMRLNKRDGGARTFILIEQGRPGDEYAATLTGERLRRARVKEELPGGFTFKRVGERLDVENFARLARRQVVEAILQTDASGRDGRIRPVEGAKWVIGSNSRREAICLHHDPTSHSTINGEMLSEMYEEAEELGLVTPLRVYGETCEIFGSDSFRFFKLPNEISNNLVVSLRGVS